MLDETLAPELLLMILQYLDYDFNNLKPFMLITPFLQNFLIENIMKNRLKVMYTLDSTNKSPLDFLTNYYSSILSLSSRIIFSYNLPIIERIVNNINVYIKFKRGNKLMDIYGMFYLSNTKVNGKVAYFGSYYSGLINKHECKMIMFYDNISKMYIVVISKILTYSKKTGIEDYINIFYKHCDERYPNTEHINIIRIPINHSNYIDSYSSIFDFEFNRELHSTINGKKCSIIFSSNKSTKKYSPFMPVNRHQHTVLQLPNTNITFGPETYSNRTVRQKSITFIPHNINKIPRTTINNLVACPFNGGLFHLDLSGIANDLTSIFNYLVYYCQDTLKTLVSFGFPRFIGDDTNIETYIHPLLLKMPNLVAVKVPKFIKTRNPFNSFKTLIECLPSSIKYLSYYLNSIDSVLKTHIKTEMKKCNPSHNLEQIAKENDVIFTMNNSIKFLDVNGYELDFSNNPTVKLQEKLEHIKETENGIHYSLSIGYYKMCPAGKIIKVLV